MSFAKPSQAGAEAPGGPSGLSDEHRAALAQASEMLARGESTDTAVEHLVTHGMPRVVAKVLVKQYDRQNNKI